MIRNGVRRRIPAENAARDRSFWAALIALRARSGVLPLHSGAGYGHRRFAIIRNAAWITLYRAISPFPQIGVFRRCTGLAGEALFTLADRRRKDIEPRLWTELGPGAGLEWGTSHHRGMIDVAAIIAAPFPWDDAAAGLHIPWLLRTGGTWWNVFSALAEQATGSDRV